MKFTKEFFLHYSRRYDKKYEGTDDKLVEKELKSWFLKHRFLTRERFIKLGLWKSKRPKKHYENVENDNLTVREISAFALQAKSERIKIESLMILKGVSWPVASVILHFAFPEKYPIMDYRVIQSLGWEQPESYTFAFWQKYVKKLRILAKKFNLPLRTIDKALWFYSKE